VRLICVQHVHPDVEWRSLPRQMSSMHGKGDPLMAPRGLKWSKSSLGFRVLGFNPKPWSKCNLRVPAFCAWQRPSELCVCRWDYTRERQMMRFQPSPILPSKVSQLQLVSGNDRRHRRGVYNTGAGTPSTDNAHPRPTCCCWSVQVIGSYKNLLAVQFCPPAVCLGPLQLFQL
jgi:hypothetical protein